MVIQNQVTHLNISNSLIANVRDDCLALSDKVSCVQFIVFLSFLMESIRNVYCYFYRANSSFLTRDYRSHRHIYNFIMQHY